MNVAYKHSRRDFLKTLSLSAMALPFLPGCGRNGEEKVDSLADFPELVEGAMPTEVYPAAGSKFVLVHIRQVHESDSLAAVRMNGASFTRLAIETHEDIRKIIVDLARQGCLPQRLYVEGVDAEASERLREGAVAYKRVCSSVAEAQSVLAEVECGLMPEAELPPQQKEALLRIRDAARASLENQRKLNDGLDKIALSHSTAVRAAALHDMTLSAVETERSLAIANKAFAPISELKRLNQRVAALEELGQEFASGKKSLSEDELGKMIEEIRAAAAKKKALIEEHFKYMEEHDEEIYKVREDEYLGRICSDAESSGFSSSACLILGGDHDLRDNIQEYNRAHPDKPCSLIVLTPVRYRKPDERDMSEIRGR